MHWITNPHIWMRRNRHPSSKCTGIIPLTHECTQIVTPQVNSPKSNPSHMKASKSSSLKWMHQILCPYTWMVNAPTSYPSLMNAPKSSSRKWMHRNLTPDTWRHRNHHPLSKCIGILPFTHECTEIVTPQVNAAESYPSHMNAPKSSSTK